MNVTLSPEMAKRVEHEISSGEYRSAGELFEEALKQFLDQRERGQRRLGALRRIGDAVDKAGLYERVVVPGQE